MASRRSTGNFSSPLCRHDSSSFSLFASFASRRRHSDLSNVRVNDLGRSCEDKEEAREAFKGLRVRLWQRKQFLSLEWSSSGFPRSFGRRLNSSDYDQKNDTCDEDLHRLIITFGRSLQQSRINLHVLIENRNRYDLSTRITFNRG